nr:PREDICTED: uncharacterized protein KIAA0754-like [Daucus carota subsp. sativus]
MGEFNDIYAIAQQPVGNLQPNQAQPVIIAVHQHINDPLLHDAEPAPPEAHIPLDGIPAPQANQPAAPVIPDQVVEDLFNEEEPPGGNVNPIALQAIEQNLNDAIALQPVANLQHNQAQAVIIAVHQHINDPLLHDADQPAPPKAHLPLDGIPAPQVNQPAAPVIPDQVVEDLFNEEEPPGGNVNPIALQAIEQNLNDAIALQPVANLQHNQAQAVIIAVHQHINDPLLHDAEPAPPEAHLPLDGIPAPQANQPAAPVIPDQVVEDLFNEEEPPGGNVNPIAIQAIEQNLNDAIALQPVANLQHNQAQAVIIAVHQHINDPLLHDADQPAAPEAHLPLDGIPAPQANQPAAPVIPDQVVEDLFNEEEPPGGNVNPIALQAIEQNLNDAIALQPVANLQHNQAQAVIIVVHQHINVHDGDHPAAPEAHLPLEGIPVPQANQPAVIPDQVVEDLFNEEELPGGNVNPFALQAIEQELNGKENLMIYCTKRVKDIREFAS